MAGTDSGVGIDPFVTRIQGFGKIVVGDDLGGQVTAGTEYACCHALLPYQENNYRTLYKIARLTATGIVQGRFFIVSQHHANHRFYGIIGAL
jgi:hypothetical protein